MGKGREKELLLLKQSERAINWGLAKVRQAFGRWQEQRVTKLVGITDTQGAERGGHGSSGFKKGDRGGKKTERLGSR